MIPLLLAFWFAPQEKPVEKASLSGTVVNSVTREPLAKVLLLTEPAVDGHRASTTTDANGHFELAGLEPGKYQLSGRRNGYVETYYGARRADHEGTTIDLSPGQQLTDLQLKLLPFAVIAGTVRDSDGEPLVSAEVSTISLVYTAGRRSYSVYNSVETDDLGQYRIMVPPGRYFVRAGPEDEGPIKAVDHSGKGAKPPEILLPTIYPGVQDIAAARPMIVEAGARFPAIDITLPRARVFRIKVHVEAPQGLTPSVGLHFGPDGIQTLNFAALKKNNGDFEFEGVPSGSYTLIAYAGPAPKPFSGTIDLNGDPGYRSRSPVEVSNADVEGIRVKVAPGAQVTGRITLEGENPPKLTSARVRFVRAEATQEVWIAEDYSFHTQLSPGRYDVYVESERGPHIKSMKTESTDVLSEGLTISGPGNVVLEIVMPLEGGQVRGMVMDKDDKPVPGATVLMAPEAKKRGRLDSFLQGTADQYGRYEIKDVPPGEYKMFAWDDVEPGVWFDPHFLKEIEKLGEPVTIAAKGHETVKLRLPPAPDR